jgi:hypothetical protein
MVSEDFPEPETPVTTMSLFLGISTDTFRKLCMRAPWIKMESLGCIFFSVFFFSFAVAGFGIMKCKYKIKVASIRRVLFPSFKNTLTFNRLLALQKNT